MAASTGGEHRNPFAVFRIPNVSADANLVVALIPPRTDFDEVYRAIHRACARTGYRCLRLEDIWAQDLGFQAMFELIYRAGNLVVDFTGRDPSVMYALGIAHTLGKFSAPIVTIVQGTVKDDVPLQWNCFSAFTSYAINGGEYVACKTLRDLEAEVAGRLSPED